MICWTDRGTESAARVCLVNPSFNAASQLAVKKMQDAELLIDQFGLSLDYPNSASEMQDAKAGDRSVCF